jgi:hypothetical protein
MWDSDLNIFLNKYALLIDQATNLEHGPLHNRIMNTMYDYISDGYSKSKSIRMALQTYKNELGAFFYEDSDTEAIEQSEDEDENEDEDDDEDSTHSGEEESDETEVEEID